MGVVVGVDIAGGGVACFILVIVIVVQLLLLCGTSQVVLRTDRCKPM